MRAERDFTVDPDGGDGPAHHEVEGLLALGQPSLANLSYILRHKELWPEGFQWDFSDCRTCAMGLAYTLWMEIVCPVLGAMRVAFDMSKRDAKLIFGGYDKAYGDVLFDVITPEMVADKIDEYLAGQANASR